MVQNEDEVGRVEELSWTYRGLLLVFRLLLLVDSDILLMVILAFSRVFESLWVESM